MDNKVLEELNKRLSDDRIPSQLTGDGRVLTVLLEPPVTDLEIYGDVFFTRFGGDEADDGLLIAQWEVCDITKEPDDVHAAIAIALSLMNANLTAGGYLVSVSEEEEDATDSEPTVMLMYRLSLPVGFVKNSSWLTEEAYQAVLTSAAVLKVTAGAILDFARGSISQEDFLELL